MSLPSINQVRHLFVAQSLLEVTPEEGFADGTPTTLGQVVVCGKQPSYNGDPDAFFFIKQLGHGGLVSSDKIKSTNVVSITQTPIYSLNTPLGGHIVAITDVVAGQVYEIKLQFIHYGGLGEQDQTYKIGMYKAKSTDTAALIAAGLAKSLQDALGLDDAANAGDITHYKEQLCLVTASGDSVAIMEADLSGQWKRGKFPVAHIPVKVFLGKIYTTDDYATDSWATITDTVPGADGNIANDCAKKLADLEYFCMGARGDEYRGVGYPRNFDTEYFLTGNENVWTPGLDPSPSGAQLGNIIDIQYFYQGDNEDIQKSQKTLSIVTTGNSKKLYSAIKAMVYSD